MGTILFVLGLLIVVGCLVYWQLPNIRRRFFTAQVDAAYTPATADTYQQVEAPRELSTEEKLNAARPGGFVVQMGQRSQILGVVNLDEQMVTGGHTGSDWYSTGRKFRLIETTKNLIAFLPQGDSGDETWFEFQRQTVTQDLTAFFRGTKENPGPARRFAISELTDTTPFKLVGKSWQIVGIPEYGFNGTGQAFATGSGTLRGVLAKEVDSQTWLFYLDVIKGEGHDGLYIGQVINPRVDIDDVLSEI